MPTRTSLCHPGRDLFETLPEGRVFINAAYMSPKPKATLAALARIARRMAHFGEVTLPDDVDDMIAHRAMLERMLAGEYWS